MNPGRGFWGRLRLGTVLLLLGLMLLATGCSQSAVEIYLDDLEEMEVLSRMEELSNEAVDIVFGVDHDLEKASMDELEAARARSESLTEDVRELQSGLQDVDLSDAGVRDAHQHLLATVGYLEEMGMGMVRLYELSLETVELQGEAVSEQELARLEELEQEFLALEDEAGEIENALIESFEAWEKAVDEMLEAEGFQV